MPRETGGPSEEEMGIKYPEIGSEESDMEYARDDEGNLTDVIKFKEGKAPKPPEVKPIIPL